MKKTSQIVLNILVLILMVLNPLSSYSNTAVQAQSISDSKSAATVDIIASKIWEGGPDEKPELWFRLMFEDNDELLEVPGVLPKQITASESIVTWYTLPKYNADGTEIIYSVQEGIWDPLEEEFEAGIPEGYLAISSFDGLTIHNIFIEDENQPPADTTPPAIEPRETEPPVSTPEPPEEPADPIEDPTDPVDPPADDTEPIELPVITPEPEEPPTIEPRLNNPVTASINWQGGVLPRPAFWLKLQKIDAFGNSSDVPGIAPIQANLATSVTWANIADYSQLSDYTVAVVDSTGAPYTLPGYTTAIDGLSVTFTFEEQNTIDVIANVEWLASLEPKEVIDFEQYPDYKIPSVYLRLYRQANENEVPVALLSTELIQLADAASTASWQAMPIAASNGTPYIYSVKQVDADGNDFTPEYFTKIESGLLVQNVVIPGSGGPGTHDLIDPPEATHIYIFTVDGAEVDRQIVKNGEFLIEPQVPVKPHFKFTGWYVNGVKIDFTQAISVTATETYEAIAQFEPVYYVFFMDGVGATARVFVTKEGISGASIPTDDVNLPIASNEAVTGWYKDSALTDGPVSNPYIIGTDDQQLWPKIEEGYYVYFVSGEGATYIEPQFVLPGAGATAPANPTRPGYTFSHWSEIQGGTPYTFGASIYADLTLYAVWTPRTDTPYTVVFWKQSVNDSKNAGDAAKTYDYADSEVRTATTGATVSPTTADMGKNYNGFHYNAAKSVSVTVKGNGTTILNVYYDRNLLTIDFHRNNKPGAEDGEYTGLYGQTLAQNGYTWPSSHRWTQNASSWNPGRTLTFLDAFIFDDLQEYGSTTYINLYAQNTSGSAQIIHYKENLDGTWSVANTITTPSGTFYFTNKYTGFTVYQYRADNGAWQSASPGGSASYNNKLEVRHKRNSYTLAFFNYNTTSRTETLLFESPLADFATYVPPKPAGIPDVYTFQGWFKDKAFTVPFDFATETMPSNSLMIFAKWAPPMFIGQVYLTVEGGGSITLPLAYGQPVDPMTMPTVKDHEGNVLSQGDDSLPFVTVPENHKWLGWATKEGDTYINFNFNTVIYHNITLYPYYVNNAPFIVSYNANGGGGTAPIDAKNYAFGSYADVLPPTGLTPPADKVFLGWECNGVLYQPGDKIRITGNMTLTAQWGDVKDKTKVTYKPGVGGTGADQTFENLIINGTITLIDNPFTPLDGYTFVGWKNMTDGEIYPAGAVLQVDNNNEGTKNILIAQWNKSYVADKIWDGGPKPTIWFQLLQNGSPYLTPVQLDGTADGPCSPGPCGYEDQPWKAKWDGLPAQDDNNNAYEYTFVEGYYDGGTWKQGPPPNYTAVYHASNDKVTNTYVIPTDGEATATKTWVNGPTPRPTVWFKLYRQVEGGTVEEVPETEAPIKELADGTTSVTWTGLAKTDINGKPYTFSVKEVNAAGEDWKPENYTKVESGLKVTNTYVSPIISVPSYKVWDPPTLVNKFLVTFQLWRYYDGAEPSTAVMVEPELAVQLDGIANESCEAPCGYESDAWQVLWLGIPATDSAGNAYKYVVKEILPSPLPAGFTQSGELTDTVTNTYVIPTDGEATATKTWVNGPTPRPTVWFQLYRKTSVMAEAELVPGAEIKELVDGTLSVTWTGLETTDIDGNVYTFSVKEVDADGNDFTPENYTKSGEGTLAITNTYVIPTDGEATATKTWVNGPTPRPTVWFQLYRKTSVMAEAELVPGAEIKELADGTLSVTWTGLETTDIDGNVYTFSVKEVDADGNDFTPENYTKSGEGTLAITNTYVIPTDGEATATKTWVNGPTPRPTVWFQLYRKTSVMAEAELVPGAEIKELADGTLSVTWTGLETTDIDGNVYTFSVKEVDADGNDFTPENYTKSGEGTLAITNTYVIPTDGEATATKTWVNGPTPRPTVWFQLYRKTSVMAEAELVPGAEIKELADGTLSVTWTGLETTDIDGNVYTFSVKEVDADGNDFTPENYTKSGEGTLAITNTYVIPTDGEATATKTWVNGPTPRPTVWFQLYRKTSVMAEAELVPGAEIKELADGTLSVTWTGLETTDIDGNVYTFSVKEVDADGNDFTPENYTKSGEGTLAITNTYVIPTDGEATATKTWVNGPTPRPTVWFQLYRKTSVMAEAELVPGAEIKELVDGTLSVTWTGLETTDIDGNVYTFSVKEVDADGNDFTPENYTKSGEGTLAITNTYVIPTDGEATATKTWVNGPTPRPTVWFQLYRKTSVMAEAELVPGAEIKELVDGTLSVTWTGLETTDIDGNVYTFSVKEGLMVGDPAVWQEGPPANYTKAENGLNVTNTYVSPIITVPSFKAWYPPALVNKFPVTFQLWRYYEGEASSTAVMVQPAMTVVLDGIADSPCTGVCGYENDAWQVLWLGIPATDSAGKAYKYVVKEILPSPLPAGFTQTGELTDTITNTYGSPTNTVEATKVWAPSTLDPSMYADLEVTFQLWRTAENTNPIYTYPESVGLPVTLGTPWEFSWADQPTHDPDGYLYTYYVVEINPPANFTPDDVDDLVVTNTYGSPTNTVEATKVWAPSTLDPSMYADLEVTFQLWRTAENTNPIYTYPESVGLPVTLGTPWEFSWADQPTHDPDGYLYTYYVVEINPPANFTPDDVDDLVVTNTYGSPTNTVEATKVWAPSTLDPSMYADLEVTFQLWRTAENTNPIYTYPESVGLPVTLGTPWEFSWADQPTHDPDGYLYTYYVVEINPPANFTPDDVDDLVVTNTYGSPTNTVEATKVWAPSTLDPSMYADLEVTFQLWRTAENTNPIYTYPESVGLPVTLGTPWEFSWADQPTHDPDGYLYTYYVVEINPPANFTPDDVDDLVVTNTYGSPTNTVEATKVWAPSTLDPSMYADLEVTFQLWRTAENTNPIYTYPESVGLPVTLGTPWEFSWADQPTHDPDGYLYTYYVVEINPPANFTPDDVDDLVVTNTYGSPTNTVEATKVWAPSTLDPSMYADLEVTFQLWRTAENTNPIYTYPESVGLPVTLGTPWEFSWADQPTHDPDGYLYTYYVVEINPPANFTPDDVDDLVVTNTYGSPTNTVEATKVWAPSTLDPSMYADLEVTFQLWRTAENTNPIYTYPESVGLPVTLGTPWEFSWADQPTHDPDGYLYTYYVVEINPPANFTPDDVDDLVVTNTYGSPTNTVEATKVWAPSTLDPSMYADLEVTFQLWRTAENTNPIYTYPESVGLPVTLGTPWEFSWADQPTHDPDGYLYTYYVVEINPPANFTPDDVDDLVVTNTYGSPTNTVEATKVWAPSTLDPSMYADLEVTFQLWRTAENTNPIYTYPESVGLPVTLGTPWEFSWADQPTHDPDGYLYTYYVVEINPPANFTPDDVDDLVVTNTYGSPTNTVEATKVWAPSTLDPSMYADLEVTFQLWRTAENTNPIYTYPESVGLPVTLGTPWEFSWADQPTHDPDGYLYTYYVVEINPPANFTPDDVDDLVVTNTYGSPTNTVEATKVWAPSTLDPSMYADLEVTFQLWRTAENTNPIYTYPESVGLPVTLGTPWEFSWADQPTHDPDGYLYTYYVVEINPPANFTPDDVDDLVVTNTYGSPTNTVEATKVWAPSTLDPSMYADLEVTFQLWRTAENTNPIYTYPESVGLPVTLGTPWEFSWADQPTHDPDGYLYTYYVVEINPPANFTPDDVDDLVVTNTYGSPTNTVEATKVWAPSTLDPSMYADLEVTFQLWRTAENTNPIYTYPESVGLPVTLGTPWEFSWADQPTHDPDGYLYTYYVVEINPPANFTPDDVDDLVVTNTYHSPMTTADSYKVWSPTGLLDSLKFNVTFQLWRYIGNDSSAATLVEPEMNVALDGTVDSPCDAPCGYEIAPWQVRWIGIPETDINGNEYYYVVKETSALNPGFTKSGELTDTITNHYDNMDDEVTADVTATKTWMPDGLLDSMKFDVEFQLYRTTVADPTPELVGLPVTLTAPDWTYTWADMPTTDTVGNPYTYYVVELTVLPPGFSKVEDGLNVTNTYDNEDPSVVEDLTATKTWMPVGLLDSLKFDVEFQLYRTTVADPTPELVGLPVTLTAPDWTYTWADMPTTDTVGNPYTYYVVELTVLPPGFSKVEDGLNVTNTYDNEDPAVLEDVTATKIWMPVGLLDSLKVPVTFQLYRYTTDPATPETVGDSVELNEAGGWIYTWADMPTTDTVGNPYTYYVEETVTPTGFDKTEDGLTVTNTYIIPSDAVVAEKVWVNGPTPRPTVWFQLWRTWTHEGTTYREIVPGADIQMLPDGTLSVFWTDIDMETIIGIPYTFYVKEVDATGNDFVPENYTKLEDGLKVTNTYVPPIMIDPLYMNKVWEGGKAPYPPIYFHLYRYIEGGTPEPVIAPVELDGVADPACVSACEISPWRVVVEGLPLTDIDGNPYTYTVRETDASGNEYTPENYVKSIEGLTVTNCYVSPKFDVTMTKIWKGGPEPRPNIRVQLYRNGEPFGEPVRLYYPNTTHTWTGLDKTDAHGVEYRYTVDEVAVPAGYSKSVVGLTITNTYSGEEPPEVPYTGDANNALLYGVLALSSLAGFGAIVVGKRRKKK